MGFELTTSGLPMILRTLREEKWRACMRRSCPLNPVEAEVQLHESEHYALLPMVPIQHQKIVQVQASQLVVRQTQL